MLLDTVSGIMMLVGGGFAVIGGIGVIRFPDVFTRLHAAGITDTMAPLLIIGGLMLQAGWSILSFKLLLILLFLLFTTPTASHATARAAIAGGLQPLLAAVDKRKGDESSNI